MNRPRGRFQPGTSGNPRGRPRGSQNKSALEVGELASHIIDHPEYRKNLLTRAVKGTLAPGVEQLLWHYRFGKPKEIVQHETAVAGLEVVLTDARSTPPDAESGLCES